MKKITVYHFDAFSKVENKGNPAGVVLNAGHLTDEEMQSIAFNVGFNETAFILNSEIADVKIRYFTPGHETNLCGHATMAAIYALKTKEMLADKMKLTIETKAGILPINIQQKSDDYLITMKQASPQFKDFSGSKSELAHSIGIEVDEIDEQTPIFYGNTGIWTLLIPIKKVKTFEKMKPISQLFPSILKEIPKASVHPFCLETFDLSAHMHARHFSSPFSGTKEDSATGTASGVMGAYYATYIHPDSIYPVKLTVETRY